MKKNLFYQELKKYILIIFFAGLLSLTTGIINHYMIKPIYKSDISIAIYTPEEFNKSILPTNYDNILTFQQLVKTYCEFAKSNAVVEDTIKTLKLNISLDQLSSQIQVAPKANTQFLNISVISNNPFESSNVANQLGMSLAKISTDIMKSNFVNIVDKAKISTSPTNIKTIPLVIMSFFIYLTILISLRQLLDYLRDLYKKDHHHNPLPPHCVNVPTCEEIHDIQNTQKNNE